MKALLAVALLAGTTGAMAAETRDERAVRETHNAEVLHRYYPASAIAAGQQGPVHFLVSLDRDGIPTACDITGSSGHATLDTATCDLILLHARFKAPSSDAGGKIAMIHKGVINWTLPGSDPRKVTATVVAAKTDPLDRRVCKRALKAGSQIIYERTCMTVREWQTDGDETRQFWQELQGKKGWSAGG